GFTIVELLIVIVVIAILAAITIVAYNGIQNRAKTSSNQAAANSMVKKFEAINAIKGVYYNNTTAAGVAGAALNTYSAAVPVAGEATLDNAATVIVASTALASTSGVSATTAVGTVAAWTCVNGTAANVFYWDYTAGAAAVAKAGGGC
ncbi:prepilin-type N-terminal cleavage/methylation domain-containing protein, partial [Microbacteriaceae bacterium]|nr:prepilin-type N-terminal cleavage/methylation domain-containing protein [Candidatus Saccharibacteria bacterium]